MDIEYEQSKLAVEMKQLEIVGVPCKLTELQDILVKQFGKVVQIACENNIILCKYTLKIKERDLRKKLGELGVTIVK